MRPPKRPEGSREQRPLEEALRGLRVRPSFGAGLEWEALETGGHTVLLTRFKKPVFETLKEWESAYPGYEVLAPLQAPDPGVLTRFQTRRGGDVWEFFGAGAQAYAAAPEGSVRALLAHAHDFIPEEIRASEAYRALALRVHLAGGSDQWVSRSKLETFLAGGRDGALTGLDWGQLPD